MAQSQSDLKSRVQSGKHAFTTLKTDERVLARITDGIYRQPASALRELIFNAYDADASEVIIQTDAPRFSQITIADDGNGMTLDVLNHLIHHIGGSAKRTKQGSTLGVADSKNSKMSPGGRKLIGKIGIGLFSVAQLTRHFQIITKPKNGSYRYVADIKLKSYSEDSVRTSDTSKFEAGEVEVWQEKASDKATSGTQIVLLELKDFSKGLLQSRDRWERIDNEETNTPEPVRSPPAYHIGSVDFKKQDTRHDNARLPWNVDDTPNEKFQKLYQAVLDEVETGVTNPSIDDSLDNYLNMIWTLSLSAPVKYVDKHPFDLNAKDGVRFFTLPNTKDGAAQEIVLKKGQTVGEAAGLKQEKTTDFSVTIDGIELLRPIRFRNLPTKSKARFSTPLLFIADCDLTINRSEAETGGNHLQFNGYIFWVPKVVPKENNGLILRIGNATGTLFDDTFMRYEVQETTRLKQITAELFVAEGLDAALNIDRESFNYSHPHYQFLTRWVHRALRKFASRHKALESEVRNTSREEEAASAKIALNKVVKASLKKAPRGEADEPSEIVFLKSTNTVETKRYRKEGVLVFNDTILGQKTGHSTKKTHFEDQLKAVAKVLDGYGLLKKLTYDEQEALLHAIAQIFQSGE